MNRSGRKRLNNEDLLQGKITSRVKKLIGTKINFLEIIAYAGNKGKKQVVECKCFCGSIFYSRLDNLLAHRVKSCGCVPSSAKLDYSGGKPIVIKKLNQHQKRNECAHVQEINCTKWNYCPMCGKKLHHEGVQ